MTDNMKYNRRNFILISAATGALACMGCRKGDKDKAPEISLLPGRTRSEEMKVMNKSMTRQEIMNMLDQRVNHYMELSGHCAQSSFLALSEQFGYEDEGIVKALSPLPGIAETGQTCGVVTGSLMIMGLVFGRERLDDWEKYRSSLKPAGVFVRKFQEKYGSLLCSEILKKEFGTNFDLLDPAQHQEFVAADAASKCSSVARNGVRIAAEVILDEQKI